MTLAHLRQDALCRDTRHPQLTAELRLRTYGSSRSLLDGRMWRAVVRILMRPMGIAMFRARFLDFM